VDAAHYQEQHEVHEHGFGDDETHREIARRAYELWQRRGCSAGSAELDWFEATEQLRSGRMSSEVHHATGESGSVPTLTAHEAPKPEHEIMMLQNFFDERRRRVPVGK
jgi:hypothetical protein